MIISKVIAFDLSNADLNAAATRVMESFEKNIIKELELFASFFKGTWEAMDFHKRARAPTPGGGRATRHSRIIGTGKYIN